MNAHQRRKQRRAIARDVARMISVQGTELARRVFDDLNGAFVALYQAFQRVARQIWQACMVLNAAYWRMVSEMGSRDRRRRWALRFGGLWPYPPRQIRFGPGS